MTHDPAASTSASTDTAGVHRLWLLALSFLGGFQIMALELCGFRVLQINLGSSVVVTGTLLTTIMVVLSVGYYLGGVLSQRGSLRPLLLILLASCLYTHIASVVWLDRIADLGLDLRESLWGNDYLEIGIPSAVIAVLLYAPPMLALSVISPCLIHLESARPDANAGKKSGFFMALSTVGSILGTLVSSYLLIPLMGARDAAAATNGVMFTLLVLTFIDSERRTRRRRVAIALGAVSVALLAALVPVARSSFQQTVVHDDDSVYGNIRVIEETDSRGHRFLAYLASQGYWHSIVYPDEPLRELVGTLYLAPALASSTPPRNLLVLGSAAGGVLRHTELLLPNTRVTGVDIDPAIHKVAVDVFGVNPKKVRFVSRDARQFVYEDDEIYDFIVVDLFAGEFVPVQCITRQFFTKLKQRLSPTGVMFINTNVNDVPYELPNAAGQPFRSNRHLETTLREAGFASLFENKFFHGLVVYPQAQSLDRLRARWLELSRTDSLPAAARAGLGLMAYTTVEAVPHRDVYRAFTDTWAPDLLIERKSNEPALFRALDTAARQRPAPTGNGLSDVVLSRLLAERPSSVSPGQIVDAAALVHDLEQLHQPLTAASLDQAARYLQFGFEEEVGALSPRSAWAQLGAGYARIYAAARANDYEALLPALEELRALTVSLGT